MADQVERVSREPGMGVIVPGDRETSPGVAQLLDELSSGDCVAAAGRKEQRPSIDSA
jgi:hypothetical protein